MTATAVAAPPVGDITNVAVGTGTQWRPVIANDTAGGLYIGYVDAGTGREGVTIHKPMITGFPPGWKDPIVVEPPAADTASVQLVGAKNGVFVIYGRNLTKAQKYDVNGRALWTAPVSVGGRNVTTFGGLDGDSFYVVEFMSPTRTTTVKHFDANGTTLGTIEIPGPAMVASDGEGGVFAIERKSISTSQENLIARRYGPDRRALWGPNGLAITDGSQTGTKLVKLVARNGASFLVSYTAPPALNTEVVMALELSGSIKYGPRAVAGLPTFRVVAPDGNGGAMIAYSEGSLTAPPTFSIKAKRVDARGTESAATVVGTTNVSPIEANVRFVPGVGVLATWMKAADGPCMIGTLVDPATRTSAWGGNLELGHCLGGQTPPQLVVHVTGALANKVVTTTTTIRPPGLAFLWSDGTTMAGKDIKVWLEKKDTKTITAPRVNVPLTPPKTP